MYHLAKWCAVVLTRVAENGHDRVPGVACFFICLDVGDLVDGHYHIHPVTGGAQILIRSVWVRTNRAEVGMAFDHCCFAAVLLRKDSPAE